MPTFCMAGDGCNLYALTRVLKERMMGRIINDKECKMNNDANNVSLSMRNNNN